MALALILAFIATRGLLGALVNPPFNGPDERGHVIEIAALLHLDVSDEDRVSHRQPRPYYLAAALAIRLLGIPVGPEQPDWQVLLPLRLASVVLGLLTTAITYVMARYALRGDPAAAPSLALAAALVAGLAPIHQFTMASAANDPLAIALAAVSTAAAVLIVTDGWSGYRTLVLVGAALAAVATKSTGWGAVIVAGLIVVAALRRGRPATDQDDTAVAAAGTGSRIPGRQWSISDRWLIGAGVASALVGLVGLQVVIRLAPEELFRHAPTAVSAPGGVGFAGELPARAGRPERNVPHVLGAAGLLGPGPAGSDHRCPVVGSRCHRGRPAVGTRACGQPLAARAGHGVARLAAGPTAA